MESKLKSNRLKLGLKQSEVANKIGISEQYYNMIENGKRKPSVTTAKRLSKLLNVNWTIFFDDTLNKKLKNNDRPSDQTQSAI